MANQPVYKVIFQNGNQVFEVFARQIYQSDMWGFIEVEEFVFGERSKILVDPSEEKLKNEFNGVKRSYIPLQAIIRIDEVDKEGSGKVSETLAGGNVASFPFSGMQSGAAGWRRVSQRCLDLVSQYSTGQLHAITKASTASFTACSGGKVGDRLILLSCGSSP